MIVPENTHPICTWVVSVVRGVMFMSNADELSESENTGVGSQLTDQSSGSETVVATSYVPRTQYQLWEKEAKKRDMSISQLISSMVQAGLTDIELEEDPSSEIIELRNQLRQVQAERDKAKKEKRNQNQEAYHVGLGKIKELIINNPGIDRHEIVNYIMENPVIFVDKYLQNLEGSEFNNRNGEWYPPEEIGEKR